MTGDADMSSQPLRPEPRRELGRTGFVATRLGVGDLADRSLPLEQCVAKQNRPDKASAAEVPDAAA